MGLLNALGRGAGQAAERFRGGSELARGYEGGFDPRIIQMGLSETTPPGIVDRIEQSRRIPY